MSTFFFTHMLGIEQKGVWESWNQGRQLFIDHWGVVEKGNFGITGLNITLIFLALPITNLTAKFIPDYYAGYLLLAFVL